jgi:hypothetical protein
MTLGDGGIGEGQIGITAAADDTGELEGEILPGADLVEN